MIKKLIFLVALLGMLAGCAAPDSFKVPPGTDLYVFNRTHPVVLDQDRVVTPRSFFWVTADMPLHGGIPYRLEKTGQTIKEGRLITRFRWQSIFWPPLSFIYWPIGDNPALAYDLVDDRQQ